MDNNIYYRRAIDFAFEIDVQLDCVIAGAGVEAVPYEHFEQCACAQSPTSGRGGQVL